MTTQQAVAKAMSICSDRLGHVGRNEFLLAMSDFDRNRPANRRKNPTNARAKTAPQTPPETRQTNAIQLLKSKKIINPKGK